MRRKGRQERLRVKHRARWCSGPSYQARTWDRPVEWFFRGLERFVNADDSLAEYQALAKAFPSFWPLPLQDGAGHDLSWTPDAHHLFLLYRNVLRGFWTRNPDALKNGFNTDLLLGTLGYSEIQEALAGKAVLSMALSEALAPLTNVHQELHIPTDIGTIPLAHFWPDWSDGTVAYVSQLDFQRAAWLLFCESWRAKVCPKCSVYFFVQKSAQLYCSLSCSNSVHQASALRWWKEEGCRRRAARTKASDSERKRR